LIWRHKLIIWNILMMGGTCLLLIGLYAMWWGTDQTNSPPHVSEGLKVPVAPVLRDQQPFSAFMDVVKKNLFSQDRRGWYQNKAAHQNLFASHQLLGIIIIGNTRAALIGTLARPRGGKESGIDVVYPGDLWNGFKVKKITNESVILRGKHGLKALTFPK
jgi:hypothetical protein